MLASVSYALQAGSQVETLLTTSTAGTTAINLTGNEFANTLFGNAGANTLNGGAGIDQLYGYGGADIFRFDTALGGGNVDTIADFNPADDTIQLENAVFTTLPLGFLNAIAFWTGTAAHDTDDRIIYNQSTGALFYDPDGTAGAAAVQFATLSTKPTISNADFAVV